MKVVAIVQARLGSARLPAKVMLDLGGATALQRCLDRVRRFDGVDETVVATTTNPEDDVIVAACRRLGVRVVRGSADDVLSRYVEAARASSADVVVRCTSDCPLLDPAISSAVVKHFVDAAAGKERLDYASNVLERRLPRGLDTEITWAATLERAHREATAQAEREHVTLYIHKRPETFRLGAVVIPVEHDWSSQRWTLDTLDDYRFLAAVFDGMGERAASASMDEVLQFLREHPAIASINAHIAQKALDAPR